MSDIVRIRTGVIRHKGGWAVVQKMNGERLIVLPRGGEPFSTEQEASEVAIRLSRSVRRQLADMGAEVLQ